MLRTRQRDPENPSLRVQGTVTLERTNQLKPSRNKIVTSQPRASSTTSGLRAEVTTDEVHDGPPYRSGGPFFSVKLYYPDYAVAGYSIKGKDITQPNSTTGAFEPGDVWTRRYDGALKLSAGWAYMSSSLGAKEQAVRSSSDYDPVVNPDDLDSLGPRAWNRLRPKVERASVAQSVIELREAPSMLRGSAKSALSVWQEIAGRKYRNVADLRKVPKEISEEFLNVQFGWKPFVKDINAVCDVVINFDKYVETTTRNNDRWLKRQWAEEVLESSTLVHNEGGLANARIEPIGGSSDYFQPWTTNYYVQKETWSQVWYKGSFKYYRPEFDAGLKGGYPAVRSARQTLSLLGANVTPTVLYKVTPWTWLGDWFLNVGDNVQRFEDMVTGQVAARYMYIMRRALEQYRYVTSSADYGGKIVSVEAVRRLEVKSRVQSAGEFSFSLQPTGLSGMQVAILAALGISRT